jgi:hypothetical protein
VVDLSRMGVYVSILGDGCHRSRREGHVAAARFTGSSPTSPAPMGLFVITIWKLFCATSGDGGRDCGGSEGIVIVLGNELVRVVTPQNQW